MMIKSAIAAAGVLTLTACASIETPLTDGYEYGDITSRVLSAQASYCEAADPYQRAVRMVLLQRAGIELPDDGACADIIEVLDGDV